MIRRARAQEKIKNVLRGLLKKKENRLFLTSALAGDGHGNVEVPDDPKNIYVRASGQVLVIFNNRVKVLEDTPLWIGYERANPQLLQVLSLNYGSLTGTGLWIPPEIGQHGWTHTLYAEHGGYDIVWVEQRQFLPLSISVTGDFEITIYRGIILTENGWREIDRQTVDLTSSIPSTVDRYRFALIYIDPDGEILVEDGALSETALTEEDIPIPGDGCYGICAVKLRKYQEEILDTSQQTDIVDLRFPQASAGAHTHIFPEIDLSFGELNDVEITLPADQDVVRYEIGSGLWKNVPLAEIIQETEVGDDHVHASFETYGNGTQREFVLPNIYEPVTTEVFINGLRQRFMIEWEELDEDLIQFNRIPLQGDLITVNYIPEIDAMVL